MRKLLSFLLILLAPVVRAQSTLYYPPLTGSTWDTTAPASLSWCADKIDSLYTFLASKNTKAFLVLKEGRIVLEKYFGSFTVDSVHMWASAGKTLTAFATGIAQEEGLLNINNPTSDYLGVGWTSCPTAKEALITIRHQLTMTTGIADTVSDLDCTYPACLNYQADAGTRWSYHNALYTLVQRVVDSAAGVQSWRQFFNTRIAAKTGITGAWVTSNGYNSVFYSKARAAARFGLLLLGRGFWNGDTLLHDTAYLTAMTRPSQMLNHAYGYLTWLNGQNSYMLPSSALVFSGPLFPNAPMDLYAALGKNDQKIYVAPSQNLVVVRMGDAADSSRMAISTFDDDLWVKLNAAMCSPAGVREAPPKSISAFSFYPNPVSNQLYIHLPDGFSGAKMTLSNIRGGVVKQQALNSWEESVLVDDLPAGLYLLRVVGKGFSGVQKVVIAR